MEKEILHKYAEDSNGRIIHIDNAIKEVNYYCPNCKEKFSFRKGEIRQRHFSHSNTSNCSSEGYLHKTFKKKLLELIKERINKKLPIEILFNCILCKQPHNFNFLQGIMDIKDEYYMGVCRPDIALIHEKGVVSVVIEIIVSHEIEEKAIEFYIQNAIIVIRIKLESLDDLENIDDKIKIPTDVLPFNKLICPNVRQQILHQHLQTQLFFIPTPRIQSRGGPEINKIDAAMESKQHYLRNNQRKNYNSKRNKRK